MKDVWKLAGVGNFPYNLPIFDLGTGFRMSDPLRKQNEFYVMEGLTNYAGDDWINKAYTDNWKSFSGACRYLQIAREKSLPGLKRTNARAERVIQDQLDGSRTALVAAGLPSCWWTYAMPHYAMMHNVLSQYDPTPEFFQRVVPEKNLRSHQSMLRLQ